MGDVFLIAVVYLDDNRKFELQQTIPDSLPGQEWYNAVSASRDTGGWSRRSTGYTWDRDDALPLFHKAVRQAYRRLNAGIRGWNAAVYIDETKS